MFAAAFLLPACSLSERLHQANERYADPVREIRQTSGELQAWDQGRQADGRHLLLIDGLLVDRPSDTYAELRLPLSAADPDRDVPALPSLTEGRHPQPDRRRPYRVLTDFRRGVEQAIAHHEDLQRLYVEAEAAAREADPVDQDVHESVAGREVEAVIFLGCRRVEEGGDHRQLQLSWYPAAGERILITMTPEFTWVKRKKSTLYWRRSVYSLTVPVDAVALTTYHVGRGCGYILGQALKDPRALEGLVCLAEVLIRSIR